MDELNSRVPIRMGALELYVSLEKKRRTVSKIKIGCIVGLLLFLAFIFLFCNLYNVKIMSMNITHFHWFFAALCIYIIVSWLIRASLYYCVDKSNRTKEDKIYSKPYFEPKDGLLLLLSPDYFLAKCYKNKMIEKEQIKEYREERNFPCYRDVFAENLRFDVWDYIKIKRKYLLIFSNWINLCISIVMFIVVITAFIFDLYGNDIFLLLFYIYLIRVISRTVEICYAFYKDVVEKNDKTFSLYDKDYFNNRNAQEIIEKRDEERLFYIHNWKNSYLLKGERLSLAVHSLIEITILYSVLYYLFDPSFFTDSILKSISVSTMNVSYPSFDIQKINYSYPLIFVMHSIATVTLIVLSIASYLGESNRISKREEIFYLYHSSRKNKESKNERLSKEIHGIGKLIDQEGKHYIVSYNLKPSIVDDTWNKQESIFEIYEINERLKLNSPQYKFEGIIDPSMLPIAMEEVIVYRTMEEHGKKVYQCCISEPNLPNIVEL